VLIGFGRYLAGTNILSAHGAMALHINVAHSWDSAPRCVRTGPLADSGRLLGPLHEIRR